MKLSDIGRYAPPPLNERGFEWAVPTGAAPVVGRNNPTVEVWAFETCCEYLCVHETVGRAGGWTITHTLTRYRIIDGIESQRAAQYLAGALSTLFRWSEDHGPYYKTRLTELDIRIQRWFDEWRRR